MGEMKIATPEGLSHRGRLGFLFKDSIIYGGAAAISKAFSLITFPLLARHFSVLEYGVIDFFLVLASLLAILFIFGQDSAVARYFYEHEDTEDRRQIISQSLLFQLVGLAVFLPLLWWFADKISGLIIDANEAELFFKIVLLQLPSLLLINFSKNLLKWTFSRAKFLIMSLCFTVVQGLLLVLIVMVFDAGIEDVLLVSLFTSLIFGFFGLYFIRHWLTRPRDFNCLCEMLPFALPYGVICVIGAFSPTLERSLTAHFLGTEELGLYAAGAKIAMLMMLMTNAFQTAWGPFSLSLYKQNDAGHTYNLVLKLFSVCACILVILLSLIAQPLIHFLASERYAGAFAAVFPLAMGLAIQAISWITEIGIGISKRSYLSLYASTLALLATFAGIWLLAPVLDLLGVGLGVMLGYITKSGVSSWLAQRAYPLPWQYVPVGMLIILTLVLGMGAVWAGFFWGAHIHTLILSIGLVMIIIAGWYLFTKSERQKILDLVNRRLLRHKT